MIYVIANYAEGSVSVERDLTDEQAYFLVNLANQLNDRRTEMWEPHLSVEPKDFSRGVCQECGIVAPAVFDFRDLLAKYINWVGECEGVDFLHASGVEEHFTPEELRMLRELD